MGFTVSKWLFFFSFLFLSGFLISESYAQKKGSKKNKVEMDTVFVLRKSTVVLPDTSFVVPNDTTFLFPKDWKVTIKRNQQVKTLEFYNKLKERAEGTKVTRELFDLVFTLPDTQKTKIVEEELYDAASPFLPFQGKKVTRVRIKHVPVLSGSVTDTLREPRRWLDKFFNKSHINTRDWIVKNNLLVKEGDVIDPENMADAERVLRQLPYIRDARIALTSTEGSEEAEMLVILQDVWSLGGDGSVSSGGESRLSVYDQNMLGLGNEFRMTGIFHPEEEPNLGFRGDYLINNIKGSFIDVQGGYENSYLQKGWDVSVSRGFVAPEIRWGGGLALKSVEEFPLLEITEDSVARLPNQYVFQNYWLGRSIQLDGPSGRKNLTISGKYSQTVHQVRPFFSADSNFLFHDVWKVLGRIAFSNRDYKKSNLIYGFGRTEDVPTGYLASLTFGHEERDFYKRNYLGITARAGDYFGDYGYLSGEISLGSFFRKGQTSDGVLRINALYFSNLIPITERYRLRQFLELNYTQGLNRVSDEVLTIADNAGVRGLDSEQLEGVTKAVVRINSVLFTPWYFYGFRVAINAFFDAGILVRNQPAEPLNRSDMYTGMGVGIRVRNESLVFKEFTFRFAYFPSFPADASNFDFRFFTTEPGRFNDFNSREPALLRLQD